MSDGWAEFDAKLFKHLGENLDRAAHFLKAKVKEKINRRQPRQRYPKVPNSNAESVSYKGLAPSNPGEPPKQLTSQLIRSISHETDKQELTARVGTNLDYGFFLEFGTTDMEARPYLRPAFNENKKKIADIINKPLP